MNDTSEPFASDRLRRLLLALVAVVFAGMAVDLCLLGHYEETWQVLPLAMIAVALLAAAWMALTGSAWSVTVFRIVMVLVVLTGAVGVGMHFNGSREFHIEMDPALTGWALFVKVMRAKAPPTLAPAAMVQAGLFGLLSTWRHPALGVPPMES